MEENFTAKKKVVKEEAVVEKKKELIKIIESKYA